MNAIAATEVNQPQRKRAGSLAGARKTLDGTLRGAGVSDAEVLEVANVSLSTFTSDVKLLAGTEIDSPVVRAGRS